MHKCPLCAQIATDFYKDFFYQCPDCKGIFMHPDRRPDAIHEKKRYLEHNNDVNDLRYQKFVSPIVNTVLENFKPIHKGLDFGAGTGPVISKLLKEKSYNVEAYDPFFIDNKELLKNTYDYIMCCEVIEHFYNPLNSFSLLKKMIKKDGMLLCMTSLYNDNIVFDNWYYKNDPTHVFIYTETTLLYIKEKFKFSNLFIKDNFISFDN